MGLLGWRAAVEAEADGCFEGGAGTEEGGFAEGAADELKGGGEAGSGPATRDHKSGEAEGIDAAGETGGDHPDVVEFAGHIDGFGADGGCRDGRGGREDEVCLFEEFKMDAEDALAEARA